MTSPITYSHHLVALTARAQAANARLAGADPDRRAARVAVARPRAAALSVWLDGSPLEESTAADVDAGRIPLLEQPPTPVTGGSPSTPGTRWGAYRTTNSSSHSGSSAAATRCWSGRRTSGPFETWAA